MITATILVYEQCGLEWAGLKRIGLELAGLNDTVWNELDSLEWDTTIFNALTL